MNTFNSKDYIVTKDGHRGYVVERLDYCVNAYQIRLASGLTIRAGEDLELDPLFFDQPDDVYDGADRFETCNYCEE